MKSEPASGRPPPSPGSRRPRTPRGVALGLLVLLLLVAVLFSPLLGDVPIPSNVVVSILLHQISGGTFLSSPCGSAISASRCSILTEIVWDVRVPELFLAALVGAALGISGATLQGLFRNPLADPYLLGLSSGAAFGAALFLVFNVAAASANVVLPLFAFLGALSTGIVILFASRSGRATAETLLLTGVALNAFLSSILVLSLLFNPVGSLQLSYWLLGGISGATWGRDAVVLGGILVAGSAIVLYARPLNLLQLGPTTAESLGVDPRAVTRRLILFSSIATAVAVAFTGIIGFVGLVAPHIVRRLFGYDYRLVLPTAAIAGSLLLVATFDVSVSLLPYTQLPIGVPMAFVGGPFFVYVLYRRQRAVGAT